MTAARTQYDNVKFTAASAPGTGNVAVGNAAVGYQLPSAAGIPNNANLGYRIDDGQAWEIGSGTYSTAASGSLARTTVLYSSNANAAINATANAVVSIVTLAEDVNAILTNTGNSAFLLAMTSLATGPELGGL